MNYSKRTLANRVMQLFVGAFVMVAFTLTSNAVDIDGQVNPAGDPTEWDGFFLGQSGGSIGANPLIMNVYGYCDNTFLYLAYAVDFTQSALAFSQAQGLGIGGNFWIAAGGTDVISAFPGCGFTQIEDGVTSVLQTTGTAFLTIPDGIAGIINAGGDMRIGYNPVTNPTANPSNFDKFDHNGSVEFKIPLSLVAYANSDGNYFLGGQYFANTFAAPVLVVSGCPVVTNEDCGPPPGPSGPEQEVGGEICGENENVLFEPPFSVVWSDEDRWGGPLTDAHQVFDGNDGTFWNSDWFGPGYAPEEGYGDHSFLYAEFAAVSGVSINQFVLEMDASPVESVDIYVSQVTQSGSIAETSSIDFPWFKVVQLTGLGSGVTVVDIPTRDNVKAVKIVFPIGNDGDARIHEWEARKCASANAPPEAVCQDLDVQLNGSGNVSIAAGDVDNGSSDPDGDSLTLALSQSSFDCSNIGNNTVTLTVTDPSGESDTCQANVIVRDDTSPTINCPGPGAINLDANCFGVIPDLTGVASASDNCGSTTITQIPAGGSTVGPGVTVITLTATDGVGNSISCAVAIDYVDVTAPTVACGAATVQKRDLPAAVTITGSDNCGSVTLVISNVSASSKAVSVSASGDTLTISKAPVGAVVTYTATATDGSGNSTSVECSVEIQNANEGVGNGVDGDTPGHDNNGGNDDAEFSPGNPGGKNK